MNIHGCLVWAFNSALKKLSKNTSSSRVARVSMVSRHRFNGCVYIYEMCECVIVSLCCWFFFLLSAAETFIDFLAKVGNSNSLLPFSRIRNRMCKSSGWRIINCKYFEALPSFPYYDYYSIHCMYMYVNVNCGAHNMCPNAWMCMSFGLWLA